MSSNSPKDGPRLLVCQSCGVMYKMRPFDGPAEYDMELIEIINRHLAQASDPRPESHISQIFRVDPDTADKLDVETAVKKELMKNEIWMRDFRDELKVEALKCYDRHNRNPNCSEYCDDSKTIGRKIGVPKEHRQYLCMYCPVQAKVTEAARWAKGMYK